MHTLQNKMVKKFRFLDALVFAFALLIIGGFSYFAYTQPKDNSAVRIKTEHDEWVYPLDADSTDTKQIRLPGPLGETVIEISGGKVGVTASPCREKICIASSPVSRPGTWLACLPNRIFIRIEGRDMEEIDATVY